MSGKGAARIGDSGSHGGTLVTGSPTTFVDGIACVRVGDTYACPPPLAGHGPNPVSGGSSTVFVDGKAVARCGDPCSCGASISSCSNDVFAN